MREGKKILNDNRVTEITEHTENSNGGEQQENGGDWETFLRLLKMIKTFFFF
jgi:hypothetical protein